MTEDKFDRGTALTIFGTDRHEDMVARLVARVIALLVDLYV